MRNIEKGPKIEKEEKEITIESATNFDELYEAIEKKGNIKGTGEEYAPEKLKELIEMVRERVRNDEDTGFILITRSEGLRNKVKELIEKEKDLESSEKESSKIEFSQDTETVKRLQNKLKEISKDLR